MATALAAGIVAGRYAALPTGLWAALALAALLGAAVTLVRKQGHLQLLTACLVAAAILFAGAVHSRLAYFKVSANHIETYTDGRSMLATIRGRIVTAPKIFDASAGIGFGYRPGPRTALLLDATQIRTSEGWKNANGLVQVTIKEPDNSLAVGQEVEILGRLGRFSGPDNPGQFDWAAENRNKYCLVQFAAEGVDGVTIRSGATPPWYRRALWRLRASARQHLATCGDVQGSRLLTALLLGERDPALRKLNQAMVQSGIAHFLSISGLHLGVFLGFVFMVCRLAALSPRRSAVVVLIVLAAYMLLAEPRAPLLRSALMAVALCAAILFDRRHSSLNALSAAAMILLILDPLQLFSAAFQLSFGIVAGLILFQPAVRGLLFGRWLRRRGLMVFRDKDRLRRWWYFSVANVLIGMVTVALTAYIVAAPLVACHFGLFCPWAPLLSVLLFPLVLAVLIPGYLAMALAWPMPNLSHAIGSLAGEAADLLAAAVYALRGLPGMSFELLPIGALGAVLCYAALLAILGHRRVRFGRVWAGATVVVAAAFALWTQLPAPAPDTAELHLLSVGAGQCAVLRTPAGQTYIIDAGTQSGFDAYRQVLGPFLRARKFPRPTAAFVSHANSDHYNAMPGLMEGTHLKDVYVNEYFGRPRGQQPPPEPEARMFERLRQGSERIVRLGPTGRQRLQLDERTCIEVLWPPDKRDDLDVNDTSLVLRVVCDGRSVLIPGDLDEIGQKELARIGDAVKSDVLIVPHHGAWRGALPGFVEAVAPKTVLVSGPLDPADRTGNPARPAAAGFFATLRKPGRYYTTSRNGWIRVRFGQAGIKVKCMRP